MTNRPYVDRRWSAERDQHRWWAAVGDRARYRPHLRSPSWAPRRRPNLVSALGTFSHSSSFFPEAKLTSKLVWVFPGHRSTPALCSIVTDHGFSKREPRMNASRRKPSTAAAAAWSSAALTSAVILAGFWRTPRSAIRDENARSRVFWTRRRALSNPDDTGAWLSCWFHPNRLFHSESISKTVGSPFLPPRKWCVPAEPESVFLGSCPILRAGRSILSRSFCRGNASSCLLLASGLMTPFFSAPGFNEKDGPVGGAGLRVVSSLIGAMSRWNVSAKPLPASRGRFRWAAQRSRALPYYLVKSRDPISLISPARWNSLQRSIKARHQHRFKPHPTDATKSNTQLWGSLAKRSVGPSPAPIHESRQRNQRLAIWPCSE